MTNKELIEESLEWLKKIEIQANHTGNAAPTAFSYVRHTLASQQKRIEELEAVNFELVNEEWFSKYQELKTASEWQPIESAPKDGTEVLIYHKHTTDSHYSAVAASWFEGQFYASSKEDIIDWSDGIKQSTHWQPLPQPPKETT